MEIFRKRACGSVLLLGASLAFAAGAAQAQTSVENFYRGKQVRILIGAGVGGTYGLYGQLAARHIGKHIPGNPNVIIQSMPGAGGNIALNYSYAVAPKDGTLLHVIHSDVLYSTLLTKGIKFNAKDYNYIGRMSDADGITVTTKKSGVATLEDMKKRETTFGVTGRDNIFALTALLMNRTAGTKIKVIAGYKGAANIMIAMERGELGSSGMSLANALTINGQKMAKGDLVPVYGVAEKRLEQFPKVPVITEFGGAREKTLMDIYVSTSLLGRSLAAPPGVPADRVAALRAAYDKMMRDPDFLKETKEKNIPIAPMKGQALADYVTKVLATPKDKIAEALKLHEALLKDN